MNDTYFLFNIDGRPNTITTLIYLSDNDKNLIADKQIRLAKVTTLRMTTLDRMNVAKKSINDLNPLPNLSFIRSQRGAPLLSRMGFVYRCERNIGIRSYWLCIRYKNFKCGGRIICNGNDVTKETSHNHHEDWQRIQKSQVEYKSLANAQELDDFVKSFKS